MSQKITILFALVINIILSSCQSPTEKKEQTIDATISKIEVLDFHSTHRCMTCNAIEEHTKFTLNNYFENEVKEGKITLRIINVDDEANAEIAEKFEASGTALMLNVINKGKETTLDLTEFAFMKGNDKEAFSTELKAKIDTALKTL
jgi:hypothetical protein